MCVAAMRGAASVVLLAFLVATSAEEKSCSLEDSEPPRSLGLIQSLRAVKAAPLPVELISSNADAGPDDDAFLKWMEEEEEDAKENAEVAALDRGNEEVKDDESENVSALVQSGSQWAWYQQTPGCHCDVHSRRRGERCRMVRSEEHYYYITCNLQYRRRSQIQGCHCEHEITLGEGWYCPNAYWNNGGSNHCFCRSEYTQVDSECIRTCTFSVGRVVGRWQHWIEVIGTITETLQIGTSSSRTDTTSESWSETLTQGFEQSATVGFEVEGISASQTMTVSESVGETWGTSSSIAIGTVRSISSSRTWSSDGLDQGTHVWQWMLDSYNECDELVGTTWTDKMATTSSSVRLPCCMPNQFAPAGACEVGGSVFSTQNRPSHCLGDTCNDDHSSCGSWVWYCTNGNYVSWMQDNCALTCNVCR